MGKKYCDFYEIILILTSSKALSRSQKDKINGWMAHNSTWSSTSSIGKRMMTMIHLSEVRGYPFKEPSSSASHPLSHSITALKKQLIYSNSLWHSFYYCPGKPAQVSGGGKNLWRIKAVKQFWWCKERSHSPLRFQPIISVPRKLQPWEFNEEADFANNMHYKAWAWAAGTKPH